MVIFSTSTNRTLFLASLWFRDVYLGMLPKSASLVRVILLSFLRSHFLVDDLQISGSNESFVWRPTKPFIAKVLFDHFFENKAKRRRKKNNASRERDKEAFSPRAQIQERIKTSKHRRCILVLLSFSFSAMMIILIFTILLHLTSAHFQTFR